MKRELRILFTGGGSGGHVYPLLAVAEAIKKMAEDDTQVSVAFHYLGPKDPFTPVLAAQDIRVHSLIAGKVRRYASLANIIDIPKFIIGFFEALGSLYAIMPDVVFSKGGTGAFGVVLAAWFYRIPVMIHESDAVPGLNNLLSARFAKRVAVSFENALQYFNSRKSVLTGTPVRPSLLHNLIGQAAAKESLGFVTSQPLIFIFGGSQGSQRINEFILPLLPKLVPMTQILHQTGSANFREAEELARATLLEVPVALELKSRYHAVPYLEGEKLRAAFEGADIIISRAGSGNIAEIAAFGKPTILIPLKESANDHQRLNAYAFAKSGGGIVIEEENLLGNVFVKQVGDLLGNAERLATTGKASHMFYRSGAADAIAKELIQLALA